MKIQKYVIPILCILFVCIAGLLNSAWAEDFDFGGPPPICPRWAFEHWVWEDDDNTRDALMELVNAYEEHEIPVGAVIIDSPWEAGRFNVIVNPITDLEVKCTANAADWSIEKDLQPGDQQYGDRAYTFASVPDRLVGARWIKTANNSKVCMGEVATFSLESSAFVYIAHDQRVVDKPGWLDDWEALDEYLYNDEMPQTVFRLFKKYFAGGATVALRQNTNDGASNCSMYTVIVIPIEDRSQYNSFKWNRNRYPEPEMMINDLHDRNIRVILWATGVMNPGSEYYEEVVDEKFCYPDPMTGSCMERKWWKGPPESVHIDFRDEDVREWFKGKIAPLIKDGNDNIYVDGFKCDMGAYPFRPEPIEGLSPEDFLLEQEEFRNFKNHYYAFFYRYMKELNPEGIIVARARSRQLYAPAEYLGAPISDSPISWQGDFTGDFDGIKVQMKDVYASAEKGYGAPGVEVGGFDLGEEVITKESLIRYAQFAAMTPLMENGGRGRIEKDGIEYLCPHEPWEYGSETVAIYKYYATLHSELVPYLFSYGVVANQTRTSILRGTNQAKAHHKLGEEIFVSIVTDKSATKKEVDFPAGARWINYWDPEDVQTGAPAEPYEFSLDELKKFPIFIRTGAIIPMNVRNDITGHGLTEDEELVKPEYFRPEGKITLNIYPGGTSSFLFHHPTGDGIAYDDINIQVDEQAGTLSIESSGPATYEYILRIKSFIEPGSMAAAGAEAFDWFYREADNLIIAYARGSSFSVTVTDLLGYGPDPVQPAADLVVYDTANADDWSIRNDLQPGDQQYGDRAYAFASVPDRLAGAQWIRTANDSKAYTGDVATFALQSDAVVYIAHDQRVDTKPGWLDAWVSLDEYLYNDEQPQMVFRLFKRYYARGVPVVLGRNSIDGALNCSMYTVIICPAGISGLTVNDTANAADWSVENDLQPGDQQYGDRAYAFASVPDRLAGAQWIRTANDSKAYTGDVATFALQSDAVVYIAHDQRVGGKPGWLDAWVPLDEYLYNNEQPPISFQLFKMELTKDDIVDLGPNTADGALSCGMYTVIVIPGQ